MESDFIVTEYGPLSKSLESDQLSNLCEPKTGIQTGPFGSQLHKKDYVVEGTPIITVEHLGENRITHLDTPFVSDHDKERLKKYSLKEGDIVFSRVGSVDRRALVRKEENEWLFSGRCLRVRANQKKLDPKFLSYFFGFQGFKQYIRGIAVGATMPSINTKILSDVRIFYPNKTQQKAIAYILGSLDDKIELNRQMNETLESIAQALFKSWFVDYDPVIDNALAAGNPIPDVFAKRTEQRKAQINAHDAAKKPENKHQSLFPSEFEFTEEMGWIPKGWAVSTLGVESEFSNGYAFKSKELQKEPEGAKHVFKMGHIKRGGGFIYDGTKSYYPNEKVTGLERYLLIKGDVLMSMTDMKSSMALLGHTALMSVDNEFLVNQRVGRIRAKDDCILSYPFIYIYTNLKSTIEELRSRANSGVQVNLSTTEIKNTNILVPSKSTHDLFDFTAKSFFERIFCNEASIQKLAKLRDTVLPKLLSGELRIPDAEKLIEDTGV